MKTLLIGNFGIGNIGDELILSQALDDYPEAIVMTTNAEVSQTFCEKKIETMPFFPTGIRSFKTFLCNKIERKKITDYKGKIDRIIFCGGGLFAIKFHAYFLWGMIFAWCKIFFPKAEIRYEHQGVDLFDNMIVNQITKICLKQANFVSVRDEDSQRVVQLFTKRNIENQGDRVEKITFKKNEPSTQKILLINALKPISNELQEQIKKESKKYKKTIFLACEFKDKQFVPENKQIEIIYPKTKTEVEDIFSQASMAIGERFHFILLGQKFLTAENTFLLRDPYTTKVASLAKKLHIKKWEFHKK